MDFQEFGMGNDWGFTEGLYVKREEWLTMSRHSRHFGFIRTRFFSEIRLLDVAPKDEYKYLYDWCSEQNAWVINVPFSFCGDTIGRGFCINNFTEKKENGDLEWSYKSGIVWADVHISGDFEITDKCSLEDCVKGHDMLDNYYRSFAVTVRILDKLWDNDYVVSFPDSEAIFTISARNGVVAKPGKYLKCSDACFMDIEDICVPCE